MNSDELFCDEGDSFLRSREPYLTPGDFATVKRQCLVLDTVLTPEEWLDQLEIECQIKGAVPRVEASHRAA